jgi:multidrug resistance efflux pump
MSSPLVVDWDECTEFHQALRMRTPAVVHATAMVVSMLVATAVSWMAITRANLVVQVEGRVRPVTRLADNFGDFNEELSCEVGGRVKEVLVREGDEIKRGDVLLRMDTTRVDYRIAKLKETIGAGEDELARLNRYAEALAAQATSEEKKRVAELEAAGEHVERARQRRTSQIYLAKIELKQALQTQERMRKLAPQRAVTEEELQAATKRTDEAIEKLRQSELPVEKKSLEVAARALEVGRRDAEVARQDLEMQRAKKVAEVRTARLELSSLELDREQSVVHAPTSGLITTVEIRVGDLLKPGKVGIAMAWQRGFQFEAVVPDAEVAHLTPGLACRVKLDAYDYQKYGTLPGTLTAIAPDSEVKEGPLSTQSAVYKLKIALPEEQVARGDHHGQIKLGMTGRAEIVTGRESILMIFIKKIRQTISLG